MSRKERAEDLLDHAARFIVEEGWESLNMEGLAARAGVSKSLPYKHFSNRDDVLLALWVRETTRIDLMINEAMSKEPTVEGRIRASINIWYDSMASSGSIHILDRAGVGSTELQGMRWERMARYQQTWAQQAQEIGDLDDEQATIVAAIMLGGLLNVGEQWIARGDPREVVVETFVAACLLCFRGVHPIRD